MVTKRQGEILLEIGRGEIAKTVADKLHISTYTVETHLKRAKKELHAHTITQAVLMYVATLENPIKYLKQIKTTLVIVFASIQMIASIGDFDIDLRRGRTRTRTQFSTSRKA